MRCFTKATSSLAVAVAASLFCITPAEAKKPDKPGGGGGGAAYDIIPFAPFDFTGTKARVDDLNENGTAAVGHAKLPGGETRSAYFDVTTQSYTTFPVGVGLWGINNLNQIVGAVGDDLNTAAFWDDLSADPVTLPPLDGDAISWAHSINDVGIIVGSSRVSEYGSNTGVVWRVANGIVVDGPLPLPALPGDLAAGSGKINELQGGMAQAVGGSISDTGIGAAVVWTIEVDDNDQLVAPTVPQGLGTLNLRDPSYSHGYSINNDGDTVGGSDQHPFLTVAGGTMEQLPETSKTVSGGLARDINDLDAIVGSLEIEENKWSQQLGIPHAFLWKDGDMIDLATQIARKSGWKRLWEATQISNTGVIAGYGYFDDERGFLMIPNAAASNATPAFTSVPEPTTSALLILGILGIGACRIARPRSGRLAYAAATAVLCLSVGMTQAAEFIPLGFRLGANASFAEGVSADGTFVVGSSGGKSFRWNQLSGMLLLPDLPGGDSFLSQPGDISNDGSVVVGWNGFEAYRWTEGVGIEALGFVPGFESSSSALAVSGDGSSVVGYGDELGGLRQRAFRWTDAGGMQDLGVLQPGDGDSSAATGISADGSIVVGRSGFITGNEVQAFRWSQTSGMRGLSPPPGDDYSVATGISADGSVIVGESLGLGPNGLPTDSQAVRWTDVGGALGLGTLTGDQFSYAVDTSGDGSVIVGMSSLGRIDTPFFWTESTGMRRLDEMLTDAGVDLTGWSLGIVTAISDDGNSIVGWGMNPAGGEEGWVARLASVPEPSTILLLALGLLTVVASRSTQRATT